MNPKLVCLKMRGKDLIVYFRPFSTVIFLWLLYSFYTYNFTVAQRVVVVQNSIYRNLGRNLQFLWAILS